MGCRFSAGSVVAPVAVSTSPKTNASLGLSYCQCISPQSGGFVTNALDAVVPQSANPSMHAMSPSCNSTNSRVIHQCTRPESSASLTKNPSDANRPKDRAEDQRFIRRTSHQQSIEIRTSMTILNPICIPASTNTAAKGFQAVSKVNTDSSNSQALDTVVRLAANPKSHFRLQPQVPAQPQTRGVNEHFPSAVAPPNPWIHMDKTISSSPVGQDVGHSVQSSMKDNLQRVSECNPECEASSFHGDEQSLSSGRILQFSAEKIHKTAGFSVGSSISFRIRAIPGWKFGPQRQMKKRSVRQHIHSKLLGKPTKQNVSFKLEIVQQFSQFEPSVAEYSDSHMLSIKRSKTRGTLTKQNTPQKYEMPSNIAAKNQMVYQDAEITTQRGHLNYRRDKRLTTFTSPQRKKQGTWTFSDLKREERNPVSATSKELGQNLVVPRNPRRFRTSILQESQLETERSDDEMDCTPVSSCQRDLKSMAQVATIIQH